MPGKTRWAVAGTGSIAARTLPDLALAANVEVIAVSSRTQPRADSFRSEYGIPRAYGTYQAMLADPDIDVVYMGFPVPATADRFWRADLGGGALLDLGVYVITFAHMFLAGAGEVTVSSVLGRVRADGVDTRALVTLAAGEATAQVATSIDHNVVPAASIAGTSGFITVDMPFWVPKGFDLYPRGLAPGAPPPTRVEAEPEGSGYVPMFRAVSEAVQAGRAGHPVHPLSATISTLELVDEVRRRLLDTYYPARGALDPWDSVPELHLDVRT